jgi:hypothetical protein
MAVFLRDRVTKVITSHAGISPYNCHTTSHLGHVVIDYHVLTASNLRAQVQYQWAQ